jgi:hypothetical protein
MGRLCVGETNVYKDHLRDLSNDGRIIYYMGFRETIVSMVTGLSCLRTYLCFVNKVINLRIP